MWISVWFSMLCALKSWIFMRRRTQYRQREQHEWRLRGRARSQTGDGEMKTDCKDAGRQARASGLHLAGGGEAAKVCEQVRDRIVLCFRKAQLETLGEMI